MIISTILKNNLKTVSRNWIYFVILIICPIILIILSGIVLNSVNFKNIRVGIVNLDQSNPFNESLFEHKTIFSSLAECINAITSARVNICVHSYETEKEHNLDVYTDNRKNVINFYARQYILEKFSNEKFYFYKQSSKDISERLSVFSLIVNNSKTELYRAYFELESQEKQLKEYQKKLRDTRETFDNLSASLIEIRPEITRLKNDLNSETNSISGNLSVIQKQKEEIENNLFILETFLSSRLTPTDYTYVKNVFDSSMENLNEIENALESINETYSSPDFVRAVNTLDSAIDQIDTIKKTLDETDAGITDLIENTQKSKNNIDKMIRDLTEGEFAITEMQNQLGGKSTYLGFSNAFSFSNDPILISFPLLISIIIVFTSTVLSNLFAIKQTTSKSYERESISPVADKSFFISAYLTNLFFILIQVVALFLIGYYFFGGIIFENIGISILSIFVSISVFVFLGMFIGYIVKSPNLSMLLAIFSVILFFIFSDILAPTEIASPMIKFVLSLNPFVILNNILFEVIVVKSNISSVNSEIIKLGIIAFVLLILAFVSEIINKKRTLL